MSSSACAASAHARPVRGASWRVRARVQYDFAAIWVGQVAAAAPTCCCPRPPGHLARRGSGACIQRRRRHRRQRAHLAAWHPQRHAEQPHRLLWCTARLSAQHPRLLLHPATHAASRWAQGRGGGAGPRGRVCRQAAARRAAALDERRGGTQHVREGAAGGTPRSALPGACLFGHANCRARGLSGPPGPPCSAAGVPSRVAQICGETADAAPLRRRSRRSPGSRDCPPRAPAPTQTQAQAKPPLTKHAPVAPGRARLPGGVGRPRGPVRHRGAARNRRARLLGAAAARGALSLWGP